MIVVAELGGSPGLAGELHAYRGGLRAFDHVLGELTVDVVRRERPEITRVELVAQESNARAIALYESPGFVREGRLEGRIRSVGGGVEADIPMAWLRR